MKARRYHADDSGMVRRHRPGHASRGSTEAIAVESEPAAASEGAHAHSAPAPIQLSTIPDEPITLLETEPQRRRWTAGRIARWALGVAGVAVLVSATWAVVTLVRFQDRIYKPLPPTPTSAPLVVHATASAAVAAAHVTPLPSPTVDRLRDLPPGRFNVLVLGTDKRPDDSEHWPRSDTLLLANVDTVARNVRILSVPRDLVVDIPGYGKNKVNAAYLFGEYYDEPGGGQGLSVQTVSKFFDVPIEYYVAVNFDGFRKVVDTVGGIKVNVPYTLDDYDYPTDDEGDPYGTTHVHFDEGWQRMNGKTALRYARTRHADNDFARSRRQLQIIDAVREQATKLDLLPKVPSLIEDLGGMIETNIPFDQQLALAQLGYNLGPSGVITAAIDASMILPIHLDDGSEGFGLDWDVAGPMLDDFFGVTAAQRSDEQVARDESDSVDNAKPGSDAGSPRGSGAASGGVATGSDGKASPSPTAVRRR